MKIILASLLMLSQVTFATQTYYFNATSGNDAAPVNSVNTPWQTIAKLNSVFSDISPGDSLLFKRGDIFYGTINIIKSGSKTFPIVIGAYGEGEDPVITGLVSLTWISAGDNLWRSKEVLEPGYVNLVTVNEVPVSMGRWPNLNNGNGGYDSIRAANSRTITDEVGLKTAPSPGKPTYFIGAEIVIRTKRWALDRHLILDYDIDNSTIRFDPSSTTEVASANMGYFIQDDSTVLDMQNEWWYNRTNKTVKMYSDAQPANVSAANLENLLVCSESYINVDGLTFIGCNGDAISIYDGSNVIVQNCTMRNIGRNAIKTASPHCSFLSNTMTDLMSKGILINEEADHTTVKNNIIKNTSQVLGLGTSQQEDNRTTFSGDGIYIKADAAIVEHNTFIKMGYAAVHLTKVDSAIIGYNFIDTVCNVLDDGGGIYSYTGDPYSNHGRKINNNIILHGIGAFFGSGLDSNNTDGAGVAGIYNDRNSSDTEVDSNTVAYFEKGIFMNYGCRRLKIRHNIFYNNLKGIQINTRLHDGDKTRDLYVTGNVAVAANDFQKAMYIYSADGDGLKHFGTLDSNYYARPVDDTLTMSWQTGAGSDHLRNGSLLDWQAEFPYDLHSKKSPRSITDSTQLMFRYNATGDDKTISLHGQKYIGIDSTLYSQDILLKPYTSIVLVRDTNIVSDAGSDTVTLEPLADAFVRDGSYANENFGNNSTLYIKKSAEGLNMNAYLKFTLHNLSGIQAAKLRIYGRNNSEGRITSLNFHSRESTQNHPQLVITTGAGRGRYSNTIDEKNDKAVINSPAKAGFNKATLPANDLNKYTEKLVVEKANTKEDTAVKISVFGLRSDTWAENEITWNNAPSPSTADLITEDVDRLQYYEFDVTAYVKSQFRGVKMVSFIIKATTISATKATKKILSPGANGKDIDEAYVASNGNGDSTRGSSGSRNNNSLLATPHGYSGDPIHKTLIHAKVYPNPTQKSFTLSFPANYKSDFILQIIDQQGKIWDLGRQILPLNEHDINIDIGRLTLSPGIYYLKINSALQQNEVTKLVIK